MTEREFAELRPWMDGDTVSVGYHPKRLVAKGYLRRVVDDFYVMTDKGRREMVTLTGTKAGT